MRVFGKSVYLTRHVRIRLRQRKISVAQALRAIESHHTVAPGKGGTRRYMATVDGKELVTVVDERKKSFVIVTSYWRN